ncbi:hypothetical protein [Salinispora oceanensis]|uniref:hypothetical protein n=1 Tax=Salinispora oceanensis TaxID=1050199 RepID=UPI0009B79BD1|nr:hypothetical protein [Salinispora oceanensis]
MTSSSRAATFAWPDELRTAGRAERQHKPELTAVNETAAPETAVGSREKGERPRKAAEAIRRLGGTPDKIAKSLQAEMTPEDLRALANLLLQVYAAPDDQEQVPVSTE